MKQKAVRYTFIKYLLWSWLLIAGCTFLFNFEGAQAAFSGERLVTTAMLITYISILGGFFAAIAKYVELNKKDQIVTYWCAGAYFGLMF